ncbi:MAG: energy-coupling factor ABC transporter permease [Rhodocyclaceae bacterium]
MNFTVTSAPFALHGVAGLLMLVCLYTQARKAAWRELAASPALHRWLGAILLIAVLWSLRGRLAPGFNLHLIGAALVTLMFGLPRAVFALTAGAVISTITTGGDWLALPLNLVTAGLLPAWIAAHALGVVERRLPAHFFIYIFIAGCMNSAIGVLAVGVLATLILAAGDVQPLQWLVSEYAPFFLLLAFAEAWLTGMALTLMVVYRPDWVASFDDRRYLVGK